MYSPVWPPGSFSSLLSALALVSGFSFTFDCELHGCRGLEDTDAYLTTEPSPGFCVYVMTGWKSAMHEWELCQHTHRHEHLLVHMQIRKKFRIVLTVREGRGCSQPQLSRVIAHHRRAEQVKFYSSGLSGERPSLPGNSLQCQVWRMKWDLNDLWGFDQMIRCISSTVSWMQKYCGLVQLDWKTLNSGFWILLILNNSMCNE